MTDKKYVYVLSKYDEDGLLEPYIGTLDRSQLEPLLTKHWPEYAEASIMHSDTELAQEMPWSERSKIEGWMLTQQLAQPTPLARLRELIGTELEADCYSLGWGWGGIQLYVIELES